jgi:hypothetical protein
VADESGGCPSPRSEPRPSSSSHGGHGRHRCWVNERPAERTLSAYKQRWSDHRGTVLGTAMSYTGSTTTPVARMSVKTAIRRSPSTGSTPRHRRMRRHRSFEISGRFVSDSLRLQRSVASEVRGAASNCRDQAGSLEYHARTVNIGTGERLRALRVRHDRRPSEPDPVRTGEGSPAHVLRSLPLPGGRLP